MFSAYFSFLLQFTYNFTFNRYKPCYGATQIGAHDNSLINLLKTFFLIYNLSYYLDQWHFFVFLVYICDDTDIYYEVYY